MSLNTWNMLCSLVGGLLLEINPEMIVVVFFSPSSLVLDSRGGLQDTDLLVTRFMSRRLM